MSEERGREIERENGQETAVIFLHIPKTAGTTLHDILDHQYPPDTIHSFGADAHASVAQFKTMADEEKRRIRLLRGHMAFGLHEYLPEGAKYFTLLREPVARVISYYNFIRRTPDHYLYEQVVGEEMSLHDLLESRLPLMMNDAQVRLISGVWGEADFGQVTPAMLETAKKNLVDRFIVAGQTEQFDKSLQLLKERLKWQGDIAYQRLNVTGQSEKKDPLSVQTVESIKRVNQQDIALYAFARDLFVEQCAQQGVFFNLRARRFSLTNNADPLFKRARQFSIRSKLRKGG